MFEIRDIIHIWNVFLFTLLSFKFYATFTHDIYYPSNCILHFECLKHYLQEQSENEEQQKESSSVKMASQLLAGVHIASVAETMAFGACLGLSTQNLFDIISNAGGNSWMFGNRVPHMLENDYTPI